MLSVNYGIIQASATLPNAEVRVAEQHIYLIAGGAATGSIGITKQRTYLVAGGVNAGSIGIMKQRVYAVIIQ